MLMDAVYEMVENLTKYDKIFFIKTQTKTTENLPMIKSLILPCLFFTNS